MTRAKIKPSNAHLIVIMVSFFKLDLQDFSPIQASRNLSISVIQQSLGMSEVDLRPLRELFHAYVLKMLKKEGLIGGY